MNKYVKRVVDGKEHLISVCEFDLGEIKDQSTNGPHEGKRSVIVPLGIKFAMQITKESIRNAILNDDRDNYEKYLDEYCRLFLNDVIGVKHHPIQRTDEGKIVGIKNEAEIISE